MLRAGALQIGICNADSLEGMQARGERNKRSLKKQEFYFLKISIFLQNDAYSVVSNGLNAFSTRPLAPKLQIIMQKCLCVLRSGPFLVPRHDDIAPKVAIKSSRLPPPVLGNSQENGAKLS